MKYAELRGLRASVVLSRPGLHGARYGVIRRVDAGPKKGLKSVSLQLMNIEPPLRARPSYTGQRVVIRGRELLTLRVVPKGGRRLRTLEELEVTP